MPTLTDQTLRDLEAIRRIKGLYCDTIDRIMRKRDPADAELLRSLWTEDAVFDFSQLDGTVYGGPAAIVELFVKLLPARVCWMWHTVGAEVIDIDGDTATGRWTLLAMAQPVGGEGGPPRTTYGRYVDEFRRVGVEWKQSKLFFLNETKPAA